MPYSMMLYDDDDKAPPALNDLFRVVAVEPDTHDVHRGRGTYVLLEPYTGEDQLMAALTRRRADLAQARAKLAQTETERINDCRAATMWEGIAQEREHALAQARAELKDLQVAKRVCERLLAQKTNSRDYWVETCRAAEGERNEARKEAQEQSDMVQHDWLSPCQKAGLEALGETLRGQLKHAVGTHRECLIANEELTKDLALNAEGEAAIVEAAEALVRLSSAGGVQREARINLREALAHRSEAATKLLERLAEAEAKRLHWFGIAQEQAWRLATLDSELTQTRAELAAVDGAAISKLRLRLQDTEIVLQAERRLRWDAEAYVKDCRFVLTNVRSALDKCQVAGKYDATATERIFWLNQRAERAEALAASTREAVEWLWGFWDGNTLVARLGYGDNIREAWDRLLAATDGVEATSLLGRLERAEALAQLVNEETARLLTQLASNTRLLASRSDRNETERVDCWRKDAQAGHVLAAQIRRALDDSQA